MFFNPLEIKKQKISLKEICSDFSCYIICICYLLSTDCCVRDKYWPDELTVYITLAYNIKWVTHYRNQYIYVEYVENLRI